MDHSSGKIPQRKNLRLPDFNYSSEGAYFITIVTQSRTCLFGKILDDEMILNDAGKMVDQVVQEMPHYIPSMEWSIYQIMPNHFHAIVLLSNRVGADLRVCPGQPQRVAPTIELVSAPTGSTVSLPAVVKRFKSLTTYRYIEGVNQYDWLRFDQRLWQRNYYEHVIRDEQDYQIVWDYIANNPLSWEKDEEFSMN